MDRYRQLEEKEKPDGKSSKKVTMLDFLSGKSKSSDTKKKLESSSKSKVEKPQDVPLIDQKKKSLWKRKLESFVGREKTEKTTEADTQAPAEEKFDIKSLNPETQDLYKQRLREIGLERDRRIGELRELVQQGSAKRWEAWQAELDWTKKTASWSTDAFKDIDAFNREEKLRNDINENEHRNDNYTRDLFEEDEKDINKWYKDQKKQMEDKLRPTA